MLHLAMSDRCQVCLEGVWVVLRKDRVLDALRFLCAQRPSNQSVWLQRVGVSAEEVAELAKIDRTNASRDLNQLVQEGKAERIPGRPVLFVMKESSQVLSPSLNGGESK